MDDIENSLIETIQSADLTDLGTELAEIGLDQLLEEGPLKDVPILGILLRVRNGVLDIRDYVFLKKVGKFLFRLREVSESDREKFRTKMRDKDLRRKVGENLTLLFDRLDDMQKPPLIGQLFLSYMGDQITYDGFQRLATAVDRAFMPDLIDLKNDHYSDSSVRNRLLACGLLNFDDAAMGFVEGVGVHYRMSDLGKTLLELCSEDLTTKE